VGQWPGQNLRVLARSRLSEYTAAAFDPSVRRVAAAGYDGKISTVSVWALPTAGSEPRAEQAVRSVSFGALGLVHAVAFGHEGTRLLAGGTDGAVRVWDPSRASTPIVLRGHRGSVNAAAFSPDDNEVVSGGTDGTVRVWELTEDGKSVTLPGPGGAVEEVAFTSGGAEVIAVGTRGARVWTCDFCGPVSEVLARARRLTTRTLTSEERLLFLHER